ncbi:DNA-binding protein [Streptosporangium carneum]|uniref:DNA-binding protein n=1 Tax=Streptosporangium carneum TaxID=47481 RepID=A0A9W6IBA0_9ACTN|nr:DNA-binding protein [Streptosporangium carneum]GLK14871.1 DNA-binding protein [Streptosporangium carneum]
MSGATPSAETGAERPLEAGAEAQVRELLEAGAVFPPGTEGGGERAVPLTARSYRHPGLEGRVVVRLVAEELGAAEDAAAGFLGLEPAGDPVVVGLGLRRSLGFPEWVLVHHPRDGHHALSVVPELERAARQAKSKPKAALDAYLRLAAQLAGAVPHFLPTFFEQAGRAFLAVDNPTYAAQMFTQARKAEAEHGLKVDEERLDAVFLEFALAGALPVKALSGYARELAARVPADEALRRFRGLCARRTAGGLSPSAQTAGDLRRLARAAGRDADVEEQDYLAELLGLPATVGAPLGWWKAHRPALVALGLRDPAVRGTLLNLTPRNGDNGMPAFWLEVLEESGAAAGLGEGEASGLERPQDGTAGWLGRFLEIWRPSWQGEPRLPGLYSLVERVAGRLRAELAETGRSVEPKADADLIDLLLALRVPVADPDDGMRLLLEPWARGEGQRDLLALAADPRFAAAFDRAADRFDDDEDGRRAVRRLAASPGGRLMLARWMKAVAGRSFTEGLPQLPDALRRLTWLPAEALVLAEEEVTAVARGDLASELARTLRGGIVDELGWPAWDEAVASLVRPKDLDEIEVADAWPHLIVSGPSQARVIGLEGTVLVHDLRTPPGDAYGDPGFHYVDGELLVYWNTYGAGDQLRGYWHSSAGSFRPLQALANVWALRSDTVTLPLPSGGRTTGAGVLHQGDTTVPARAQLIGDGTSFWVWDQQGDGWREYDPVGMEHGRPSMPGFLADALRSAPVGATFRGGWLLPVSSEEATPVAVPVNGLLGWRVIRLPDGSWRGEDLAGRAVTLRDGSDGPGLPAGVVTFPGDDRPRALAEDYPRVKVIDPEGVVVATVATGRTPGAFAAGTAMLPPLRYWRCLRPRDPEGSLALRRIDDETAIALLKAAVCAESERRGHSADSGRFSRLRHSPQPAHQAQGAHPPRSAQDEFDSLIRTLLPQVTHEALIAGIAGIARFAATQQIALDAVAARLARALEGGQEEQPLSGPTDQLLARALNGLHVSGPWWYGQACRDAFQQIRTIGQALRAASEPTTQESEILDSSLSVTTAMGVAPSDTTIRLHFDGPQLPYTSLDWEPLLDHGAAVAYRAASVAFEPEHTEALRELLHEIDELGLASAAESGPWRRFSLWLDDSWLVEPGGNRREGTWRGLLPLPDGAFIVFQDSSPEDGGCGFTALFHDPAGRFEVPAPYTVRARGLVGEERPAGWLKEFLARWSENGPAPWRPEAAEEFVRLTGVTLTTARLVVAGLPYVDGHERSFLPAASRAALGLKAMDAAVARDELREMDAETRRRVVGALLPANPAALWTDGPDVAAAAAVWNARVGRRAAVPEWIVAEAARAVRTAWEPGRALPALLDPASAPELSGDLRWRVHRDRVSPVEEDATGFTESTLVSAVSLTAWLAHRLPAGDPVRAALPAALAAVRERLANPDLMLSLGRYVNLPGFRKVAGTPSEVAEGWERYGAVIMATHDNQPAPGIRMALLDASGEDPYLPALRALAGDAGEPFPVELALRVARDPRFETLLADPGDPVDGKRAADGTWWPQDPGRSAPALVSQAASEYGLGQDAATLYLTLLAMPDPTDKNVTRWTGWKPARFKAARAELAATDLVVEASRARAGRSLFLPGAWIDPKAPRLPLEQWKIPLYDLISGETAQLGVIVPVEPAVALYARAWQRVRGGDVPRFEELRVRRGRRR